MRVSVEFPLHIQGPNVRGHWGKLAGMRRSQRLLAWAELRRAMPSGALLAAPITVRLTRIGPRPLDGDNLQGAFKAVRDGVQDWLGIDDGSSLLRWVYEQEHSLALVPHPARPGKRRKYAHRLRIEIEDASEKTRNE